VDDFSNYSVLTETAYMVCSKNNENDFFAQRRRARKGKWMLRQEEGEPSYTV